MQSSNQAEKPEISKELSVIAEKSAFCDPDLDKEKVQAAEEDFTQHVLEEEKAFMEQSKYVRDEKMKGACFLSDESDSDEDMTQTVDIADNADQTTAADATEKLAAVIQDAENETYDDFKKSEPYCAGTMDINAQFNTAVHAEIDIKARDMEMHSKTEEPLEIKRDSIITTKDGRENAEQQSICDKAALCAENSADVPTRENFLGNNEAKSRIQNLLGIETEFDKEKTSSHGIEQDAEKSGTEDSGSVDVGKGKPDNGVDATGNDVSGETFENDSEYHDDGEDDSSSNSVWLQMGLDPRRIGYSTEFFCSCLNRTKNVVTTFCVHMYFRNAGFGRDWEQKCQ